jgi:uncharacterized membrane protein YwaF
METPKSTQTSMESKLEGICSCIKGFELNLKSFIVAFLDSQGYNMSFQQRFWGTNYVWSSTEQFLASLQRVICAHMEGKAHWENFILAQVILPGLLIALHHPVVDPFPCIGNKNCHQAETL